MKILGIYKTLLLLCYIILVKNGVANNPKTNKSLIVQQENARFSILSSGIIRMEWDENAQFGDNASLVFVNRDVPKTDFESYEKDGWLTIKTSVLELKYKIGSGRYTSNNLKISFNIGEQTVLWKPGDVNHGNLLGTKRTLDMCTAKYDSSQNTFLYGPGNTGTYQPLDSGLISRSGWTLIDDSNTPIFDNSDYPWAVERKKNDQQDWYFFAYGHDYKTALKGFTMLAGNIPIPPKYAFGVWWSKWWSYTDIELKALVNEYKEFGVPLDVLVIDMDWHLTDLEPFYDKDQLKTMYVDSSNYNPGWTGYTWNKTFFPDYKNFLEWTDEKNIHTCLNIHPADGILPHEKIYPQMAKAQGMDITKKQPVKFNIVDKKFTENYMKLVLNPYEKAGVDFWWNDWQQWDTTSIDGVNPTFYLNYLHFTDMARRNVRPLVFHRWGGLGNHRYPIGFSGDTYINWKTLEALPYYTYTAANVGYGYWSHDVGGFYQDFEGDKDLAECPELFTRWVQMASLSPIFRTHAVKVAEVKRKIWEYPSEYFMAMKNALKFRYSLFPYFYTAARKAYDSGISLNCPMYYNYPLNDEAYQFKGQYMLGEDILVSPILTPFVSETLEEKERKKGIDKNNKQFFIGFGTNTTSKQLNVSSKKSTENRIVYEVAIPWKDLSDEVIIKSGAEIALDIYIGDNDGNGYREGIIAWNTNKPLNSKDPLCNGLLKLGLNGKNNTIGFVNSAINIDGEFENVWESVETNKIEKKVVRNPSIKDAEWRALWDSENLYLFIEVEDDVIFTPPSSKPWEGDGVELYIDLNPIVNQTYCYQLSEKETWLPEGHWFEWATGKIITGNTVYKSYYPIESLPVFVKENAIIPQQPEMLNLNEKPIDPLIINVFPGRENSLYKLYDDDGKTQKYQDGSYTFTEITNNIDGNKRTITIHPVQGKLDEMLENRSYEIRLPLSYPPKQIQVNGTLIAMNNKNNENNWEYDGAALTTIIYTDSFNVHEVLIVEITESETDIQLLSGVQVKCDLLQQLTKQLLDLDKKVPNFKWEDIVSLSQTGNRISLEPNIETMQLEINNLNSEYLQILENLRSEATFDYSFKRLVKLLETGV